MESHSVISYILLAADVQTFTLLGFLLFALLLLSFAISGAEVAIFSLSSKDVNSLKTKQHVAAKKIVQFLEEPKEVFASLLIASLFINISITILANFLISQAIPYGSIQFFGKNAHAWNYALEMIMRVGIIGFILAFFCEILPKAWATQNSIQFAYNSANVVEGVHFILHRISKWVVQVADNIGKRLGANRSDAISIKELDEAIDVKPDEEVSPEEKSIMKGIVKFGSISVKQIMRTRLEVNGISYSAPFHEVIQKVTELHYSRLPVYKGSLDEVTGILNTKDLIPFLHESPDFDWHPLMRQPYFVPESKPIADLLNDFQTRHVHFAVVVDEFGGTSGIVTMEDVMEEVIGDIRDEFDEEESRNKQEDQNNFLFEGKTMIHDVCKTMHLPMDTFDTVKGDSESIGGLVLELAGQFPTVNTIISINGFDFTVLEVNKNRVQLVKVTRKPKE